MHNDIEPIEIEMDLSNDPRFLPETAHVPKSHFTHCADLIRNFAVAPIVLRFREGGQIGQYVVYCDGELQIIHEFQIMDWFMSRGMSRQSAIDLLFAVNLRNRNRI